MRLRTISNRWAEGARIAEGFHVVHVFQHGAVLLARDPCPDRQFSALHPPGDLCMPAVSECGARSCVDPCTPAIDASRCWPSKYLWHVSLTTFRAFVAAKCATPPIANYRKTNPIPTEARRRDIVKLVADLIPSDMTYSAEQFGASR